MSRRSTTPSRRPRGLSLIELMVGMAVGLVVVAAALHALAAQARLHRSAVLEARLVHDLNAAGERLHRSLRRAGAWAPMAASPAGPGPLARANPYAVIAITDHGGGLQVAASRDAVEDERVGPDETLAWRVSNGTLEVRIGASGWQALTDATRVRVTALQAELRATPACDGARALRWVEWTLRGQALADPQLQREVRGLTRVRNDQVEAMPCPPAR